LQSYFSQLLYYYKHHIQAELLQFFSPSKLNIVICGSKNSGKSTFMSSLIQNAKNKINQDIYFSSVQSKKHHDSSNINNSYYPPLVSCQSVNALASTNSPFLFKLQSYSTDFPFDYSFDSYLFRVDVEEQTVNDTTSKDHYVNLLSRWSQNDNKIIVCINLSNMNSYVMAVNMLEAMCKLIVGKCRPIFVVVGVFNAAEKQEVSEDSIRKLLMKGPLSTYISTFVGVNALTGEGSIEAINFLIRAMEKLNPASGL